MSTTLRFLFIALGAIVMITTGTAAPLNVGDNAPRISATTDGGKSLNLGDLYAKTRYTLVYFYPRADTPGCTAQGCSLRDAYTELTEKGVVVIGVSNDTIEAQKAFREKYHLPFTLIADTDFAVIRAFGQQGIKAAKRQAYLVRDGKIVYADHTGSTAKQAADILAFIATDKA
ncbi:MAG: peroxiredoxin [Opitutaceae bacterium]|nr:peroxiredoxin [Opitutaceae bacterium]